MEETAFEVVGTTSAGHPAIRFNTGAFPRWSEFVGAFGFSHKGSAVKRQLPNGDWVWILEKVTVPEVQKFVDDFLEANVPEKIELFSEEGTPVANNAPASLDQLLTPLFNHFPETLRKSLATNIARTTVLSNAPVALAKDFADFRIRYFGED